MSEGEFKKRINSTLVFGIVHQKPLSVEIDEILDEAKKDFPLVNPDDHWFDDGFPIENDTFQKNQLEEINKWFKKWFGEAEK